MPKQVLTTSEAARLLGVSVRTAQLLIENGPLKSWKTPGGHRRVYLADVMAYMAQHPRSSESGSALALLVASPARTPLFDGLLDSVGECQVLTCADVYHAAFTVGVRAPAVVVVDTHDDRETRRAFLNRMSSHPELGATRFIEVVAARDSAAPQGQERMLVTTPDELPGALRALFTPSSSQPDPVFATDDSASFPLAANELQRLSALQRTGLLGTDPEPAFDRLTWLASRHLRMPVSLMTLLSATHQHFKSRVGLDLTETPRSWAMCNRTILQRHVYTVPDLTESPLFATNPAVAGAPYFRFYAGAPVFDPDGFALGSICVMDYRPHELDAEQSQTLLTLASIASDEVRRRVAPRMPRAAR
ncbi:MAG: histidine kinase [Proteobacteria bacterium]|nr:MAG: histidine kinase [Pseudomonadota bacterium]